MLEPGGKALASQVGLDWKVGDPAGADDIERLASHMADVVLTLAGGGDPGPGLEALWVTPPLNGARECDAVVFSGGVGEYVYGHEREAHGDLGAPLGRALRRRIDDGALPGPLVSARECIRATVMGAAQHTVQVSGNTIYRSDDDLLPRKNLQVLRPPVDLDGDIDPATMAQTIRNHFTSFDLTEGEAEVALVFVWQGPPAAFRIAAFCRGLMEGLPQTVAQDRPIYLVFDHDMAGLVGTILKQDFGLEGHVLALDGITLRDFDFIDLGRVLEPSGTVPVTIKSLVFQF